jgi:hypothetical protein
MLPYVCSGSYITNTMTHLGKIDAMFDYFKQSNKILHK